MNWHLPSRRHVERPAIPLSSHSDHRASARALDEPYNTDDAAASYMTHPPSRPSSPHCLAPTASSSESLNPRDFSPLNQPPPVVYWCPTTREWLDYSFNTFKHACIQKNK